MKEQGVSEMSKEQKMMGETRKESSKRVQQTYGEIPELENTGLCNRDCNWCPVQECYTKDLRLGKIVNFSRRRS